MSKKKPKPKPKKKVLSPTEKKLRRRVYYVNSVNKKINSQIEKLGDLNKMMSFEGRKIKKSTYKNILRNKIVKNNTENKKTLSRLEKQFKYVPKNKKRPVKKPASKKGVLRSIEYFAWETKDAKEWISEKKDKKDPFLLSYFLTIDSETLQMDKSDQVFIMTYNKKTFEFNLLILE